MNALYLALAYLRHHLGRSLVMVAVVALILAVPLATRALLSASERQLTARAEATPLLLGRRGSALDLTMNALYFADARPVPVAMQAVEAIWESGLAIPVPLHTAFESEGFRIVGTSLDYLDFRGLEMAQGRRFAVLGEAVIGASVARRLGKGVGDTLVSAPQNLFDLDGVYPLEMPVVGVLAPTRSPDDDAIFVDVKTAWVISGIGHGHDDMIRTDATSGTLIAPAGIRQFNRITEETLESFHFHGDPADYPVSAVIVLPNDTRSATILRGRYLDPEGALQMIEPAGVVAGLVDRIFRIRTVLDAVAIAIGAAALAAVGLAVYLSFRLRAREMETAVKLGARRGVVVRLLAAETLLLLTAAVAIAAALGLTVRSRADAWVGWLLGLAT
jgi:putative ABC transport system permease protein